MGDVVYKTVAVDDLQNAFEINPSILQLVTQNLKPQETAAYDARLLVPINAYDQDYNRLFDFSLVTRSCRRRRRRGILARLFFGWMEFVNSRALQVGHVLCFSWLPVGHRLGLRVYTGVVGERLVVLERILQPNGIPRRRRSDRVVVANVAMEGNNLPGNILGHALSLLPSKYAVATSNLSSQCKKSQITRFEYSLVPDWINAALYLHKVTKIELSVELGLPFVLRLPELTCQNLMVSKLDCNFILHVPKLVTFPFLKVLFFKEVSFPGDSTLFPSNGELRMDGLNGSLSLARLFLGWMEFVNSRALQVGQVLCFSWLPVGHRLGLRVYTGVVGERLVVLARILQPNGIPRRRRSDRVVVANVAMEGNNLPGNILGHALSLLPSKYAVATSNLSSQCKKSQITRFEYSLVTDWINVALYSHKVTKIELSVELGLPFVLRLPELTCQNLTVSKLDCNFILHVPKLVTFPCLKVLFFKEVSFPGDSTLFPSNGELRMDGLNGSLSGCPLLEELVIIGCGWNGSDLVFCNSLLKKLTLDVGTVGLLDQLNGSSIHFNVPSLVLLKFRESVPEKVLALEQMGMVIAS